MAKAEITRANGEVVPGTYSTLTVQDTQVANAVLMAGQRAAELELAKADLAEKEAQIAAEIKRLFPELDDLKQAAHEADVEYKAAEELLREKAREAKALSPDRTDWFGVVVSTDTSAVYDAKKALEWCKVNLAEGLRTKIELDAVAFKQAAAAMEKDGTIDASIFRTETVYTSRIDVKKLIAFADSMGAE